jgi:RNA polymerase sigma factor (sigma-70 family)
VRPSLDAWRGNSLILNKQNTASAKRRAAADPDEVSLVSQVARGDEIAFETLFRRYHPRLRRLVEQMTRRPHLVDEILNDTMLVVWRKAHTFNLRSKVSTWIIGIALRRGLKALHNRDEATGLDPDATAIPAECGPEEQLQRKQLHKRLNGAIGALPAQQRAVIELTFYEGYTYREIATIIDCPVDTVKTRMFHARRRLKELLAERREEAA